MNTLIKSVAIMLLTLGSVCAETLTEAEKSLTLEAVKYKNHPLYFYLKPEGYKALDYALNGFPIKCLKKINIESKSCEQSRSALVERLIQKYNFKNITSNDFKDKNLWLLHRNFKKLYNEKIDNLNKKMQALKLSKRMALIKEIKIMRAKEKYLTSHFLKSRVNNNAPISKVFIGTKLSNEIKLFKNHPLYHYMQIGGDQALAIALSFVEPRCTHTKLVHTKDCELQRRMLVDNLSNKFGFKNLKMKDFENAKLWDIQDQLRKLYIAKMHSINQVVRSVPIKNRWEAKKPARELKAKQKLLTQHLVHSRIN